MIGRAVCNLDSARERVRTAVRLDEERAAVAAQSKERVADLRKQIADRNLMNDPEIRDVLNRKVTNPNERLPMFRDRLVARILRSEAEQAHPGAKVFDSVKIAGIRAFEDKVPCDATFLPAWRTELRHWGIVFRDDGTLARGTAELGSWILLPVSEANSLLADCDVDCPFVGPRLGALAFDVPSWLCNDNDRHELFLRPTQGGARRLHTSPQQAELACSHDAIVSSRPLR